VTNVGERPYQVALFSRRNLKARRTDVVPGYQLYGYGGGLPWLLRRRRRSTAAPIQTFVTYWCELQKGQFPRIRKKQAVPVLL